MGRSQLKYRSGRGGGRNTGSSGRWGRGGKSSGGHTRELESNASRYRENTGGEVDDEEETISSEENHSSKSQRQFFASEQAYRDITTTSEAYFQTKSVKEWEDDTPASFQYGALDFNWIAAQLADIPPSQRYNIDPKYCEEFDFDMEQYKEKQRQRQEKKAKEEEEEEVQHNRNESQDSVKTTEAPVDENLEELLAMTSSDGVKFRPKKSSPKAMKKSPVKSEKKKKKNVAKQDTTTVVAVGVDQQHQQSADQPLEDWLDDVLDI